VTDPLGGQTSLAYDANGNLLTLTDALTHPTTYAYDANDQVATRTDALQKMGSYQYDKANHLMQSTDRKGQVTSYQYDALDRLSRITYADASTIDYTYDLGDRCTQIVDSLNGTITRAYDGLDRMTSEVSPNGTVSYTYEADGRRASFTVTGQAAVTYGYDSAHRLTSITQGSNVVALTYDNANRRSTLTFPNGILATYGYDTANQLTSLAYTLSGNAVGDLTYTYDASGRRTSVGGAFARTGLPQALASAATYDAGNRVATWGGQTFSYDANGNLGSDGLTSYTWNARDELIALSGGASAAFAYDAVGRRRGKTVSGTATNFLFDGLNLVQELTSGGTPTANLLTGLGVDEIFTRTDSAGTSTLLTDVLQSTIAVATASGNVQTHYTYETFGATNASGDTNGNAGQFTGRENDGTGLYYYRSRYYSPQLQRFAGEDPFEFRSGDVNLYAYVRNGPTNWIDPSGMFAMVPPPFCDPRKYPFALMFQCNPLLIGLGPLFGAGAGAGAGSGAGSGAGAGAGGGSGAGAGAAAGEAGSAGADATAEHFARQLGRDGLRSLERSLRSIERQLAEHLDKIDQAARAGRPTSSLEREVRAFQHQIEVLKRLLGK
jgi:RHS repeat-associated protein